MIAFIVIKFIVYPGMAALTGSSFPVVAVVSESMEHEVQYGELCGYDMESFPASFDTYWDVCGDWYEDNGISKEQFASFPLSNGFNKGDIIVLAKADDVVVGDVLVFWSYHGQRSRGKLPDKNFERETNEPSTTWVGTTHV